MSLTPEQVQIIKATVPVLKEHGNDITTHFYATVLKENPSLNNIFNRSNQANNSQPQALAASLFAYASHIDDLGVLSPAVEKICQKHASLYVQPAHYEVVGTYLLRAMGDILGEALTPPVLEAWGQAYWQLANIMIGRENTLYKASEGWTDWRDFRITRKEPESAEITSFYLEPVDRTPLPSYLPGQYISIKTSVPALNYMQPRQYSLSDAPNPSHYRISVKKEPGLTLNDTHHPAYVSNVLHSDKQVGDVVGVSHPAGDFYLDTKTLTTSPVVLLSAGVGLTPMLSILNTLISEKSFRRISWVHATRSTAVQAFGPYVQDVVSKHDNVTSVIFNKNPAKDAKEGVDYNFTSRMDLDVLDSERDLALGDKEAEYFICGPEGFMTDMAAKLKEFGVEEKRIKLEIFDTGMLES